MKTDLFKHRFTVSIINEDEILETLSSGANWVSIFDDMIRCSGISGDVTFKVFDENLERTVLYIKAATLRKAKHHLSLFLNLFQKVEDRYDEEGEEFGSSIAVEA